MAAEALPDFDHSLALAQGNLGSATLAECHGVACGLLVRQPGASVSGCRDLLALLEIVREAGPAFTEVLAELLSASQAQLADQEMGLALWLPDDDEPLEERTEALAQWCNGFLAGIGAGDDPRLEQLSGEASEALADIQEIALAELGDAADAEQKEALEEEEGAFAEIVEYVRIAVLILREDLRGPRAGESIH
jgi:hypothetical protein